MMLNAVGCHILVAMAWGDLIEERLTHSVIGVFFDVYNALGFGFLETLYLTAMEIELVDRGHSVAREFPVKVHYRGREIGTHRLDMVVDQRLVLEAKSTVALHPAADRQVFNYLKATRLEVGLLLHFGPKPRFRRMICRPTRKNAMYSSDSMYKNRPLLIAATLP